MSTSSHLGMRIAFVAVAIVLWFWMQRLVSAKAPVKTGVGDRLHDWSAPLHAWFLAHPRATNLTLILTSVFIDLFGLYLFASSIFGPTLQPLIVILVLFSMRQTCQAICTLPIPTRLDLAPSRIFLVVCDLWHQQRFFLLRPYGHFRARCHPARPHRTALARRCRRSHRGRRGDHGHHFARTLNHGCLRRAFRGLRGRRNWVLPVS